jgi:hypothetical protein
VCAHRQRTHGCRSTGGGVACAASLAFVGSVLRARSLSSCNSCPRSEHAASYDGIDVSVAVPSHRPRSPPPVLASRATVAHGGAGAWRPPRQWLRKARYGASRWQPCGVAAGPACPGQRSRSRTAGGGTGGKDGIAAETSEAPASRDPHGDMLRLYCGECMGRTADTAHSRSVSLRQRRCHLHTPAATSASRPPAWRGYGKREPVDRLVSTGAAVWRRVETPFAHM